MYIRAEDLGIVYIGPFPTREAAQEHMSRYFPAYRSTESGYNDSIVEQITDGPMTMVITPEADIIDWKETY